MLPETRRLLRYIIAKKVKNWAREGDNYSLTLTAKHTYLKVEITAAKNWSIKRIDGDIITVCDKFEQQPDAWRTNNFAVHHWKLDQALVGEVLGHALKSTIDLYKNDVDFVTNDKKAIKPLETEK